MRPAATFARTVPVRAFALGAIAALLLGTVPASAAGGGVKTSQTAMLTAVGAGITVEALITVGEPAGDGRGDRAALRELQSRSADGQK